jgi:hypothetical protein
MRQMLGKFEWLHLIDLAAQCRVSGESRVFARRRTIKRPCRRGIGARRPIPLEWHPIREEPFSGADDHRADDHLKFVDQTSFQRVRGELGP